jgi:hypothetical protein
MLKKTIKYTDYNGKEQTEDFYFNLTKSEIIAKEAASEGGYSERLTRVGQSKKGAEIMAVFQELVADSYGEKSEDGKQFAKSPEISARFMQSAAYDVFFMELVTNAEAAVAFANGIMPPDLLEAARKDIEAMNNGDATVTPINPVSQQSVSDIAREQSEAQLQGHKPAQEKEVSTPEPVPDIPDAAPEESITESESPEHELARLRAQIAAQTTPVSESVPTVDMSQLRDSEN